MILGSSLVGSRRIYGGNDMFTRAIVRRPCEAMRDGISTAGLGLPDYELAYRQHANYVTALEECGLAVTVLPAEEAYPDGTFVEDTAVMLPSGVILTRPGAVSRRGEVERMRPTLESLFNKVSIIESPGTLEGGDVLMVGSHFYIGISERTNQDGAQQMIGILEQYGLTGCMVHLKEMLHLKSGVSYLERGNLLVYGEFVANPIFSKFTKLRVDHSEAYASNSLWVNDTVLVPQSCPMTALTIKAKGYVVKSLDVSEFQKLDGGLSCLSLRFSDW